MKKQKLILSPKKENLSREKYMKTSGNNFACHLNINTNRLQMKFIGLTSCDSFLTQIFFLHTNKFK